MKDNKSNNLSIERERKSRLRIIVAAHFLIVGVFFVTVFFWGNFA